MDKKLEQAIDTMSREDWLMWKANDGKGTTVSEAIDELMAHEGE